ncbi:UDP-N-acetylmuramoyl-L-alanine--D-glutamate ligase [Candidatus Berkiella aquae]|uniref:UDP-N-acetylmuramoylalanine--D-glutamate ligase n=1 Tax=Candidatus Berkiella aquae TaxID=295108 RepID=A0A0Q9YGR4_9GAMM|nr:UDP-N-acetylmuramoyl-L-alanine--D-glutamate ligase [Candidatus Berkiella aquae]MCS5710805.1 UDP-N-acetylmuramoyl-L-alanine--D-glutamate ligase [Candidatus Berkiella aquae]
MKKTEQHIVIGLGITGLSCARFLSRHQLPFVVMDSRENPPNLEMFRQTYPDVAVYTGKSWPQTLLNEAKCLVVSPGVAVTTPAIATAKAHGVDIIGDIELFARHNQAPIIAITGANGKSTVTTLVGEMAKAAGRKVAVVGNIGTPVLDVLSQENDYDLVVMELSSFQLETTYSLRPIAATVLNITPDHLDRYASFADYAAAKHRIYHEAQHAIINQQDLLSMSPTLGADVKRHYFTLSVPSKEEWGLCWQEGTCWLAQGETLLLPTSKMKMFGQHNFANALSALALGSAAGLPMDSMLQTLQTFSGLAHRCQSVACVNEIQWVNDSKGTNIGACQAALEGIGKQLTGKIVLLLGGDGKGADFNDLAPMVTQFCRQIIVMGKDTPLIQQALAAKVETHVAHDMQEAVQIASMTARAGDVVLLSPACSSLDQYRDFAHRGETFVEAVKRILHLDTNTH